MKDNLPEINFKAKTEKKGGFLGFLRGLGSGGKSLGGAAGLGGASSAGLGGLIAGNIGTVLTIAAVTVAGGVYMVNNSTSSNPVGVNSGSFSSNRSPDSNYVPAILRSQQNNQGSSLNMFTDTNKGSGLSMNEDGAMPKNSAGKPSDKASASSAKADAKAEQPKPDGEAMAQGMVGQAMNGAGAGSSLTSQIGGSGGGSNRMMMSSPGGKNQNALGGAKGLSGGVGTGFTAMPKFQDRKSKLLAMKGAARPVMSGAGAGGKSKYGTGSRNQLNAMRGMQKSYTGTSADTQRYTQDAAWTGTTAGQTTEGTGLGEGEGAGIVTSPSLDNAGTGGGGGTNDSGGIVIPECTGSAEECTEHVEEWEQTAKDIQNMIYLSAALSVAGAICIKAAQALSSSVWGQVASVILYIVGYACVIGAAAAAGWPGR